jgi:hypothetical protein
MAVAEPPPDPSTLAAADCQRDAANLAQFAPGRSNDEKLAALAQRWAAVAPEAAFQWAAALGNPRQRSVALTHVLAIWGALHPREAITGILNSSLPEAERDGQLEKGVASWFRAEPQAAQRWLQSVPDQPLKTQLLTGLARRMDAATCAAWLGYAASGLPDEDRSGLQTLLVHRLASIGDPLEAVTLTAGLGERTGNFAGLGQALALLARTDLERAVNAIPSLPPAARTAAVLSIADQWIATDPAAAASYIARQPPGEDLDAAYARAISVWAERDPSQAAQYVSGLPASSRRDLAVERCSYLFISSDPRCAFVWANSIASPALRESVVGTVLAQWLANDQDAALPYLENAGLGTKAKEDALSLGQKMRQTKESKNPL